MRIESDFIALCSMPRYCDFRNSYTIIPGHVILRFPVLSEFDDVAAGKSATQSTTLEEQGEPLAAGLAVDADPNTCSVTEKKPNQWWQIDLGDSFRVSSVNINTGMILYLYL